jgi:glyoxylase-like metal-dependent hydrolase (beta-lactamase superfamily II)
MTELKEVASHIYLFDNKIYGIPEFGACYILGEDKKAIIDCGPTTSLPYVLEALEKLSLKPADIDYLILTHIHLDHAGGAGMLLKQMPQAKVFVHRNGARHLINPAKLIASVIEAQGEAAYRQNGEIVPIEAARVQIPDDGDKLKLSDSQTLTFYDGLGHSPHELCIAESRNKGVFVGDAVGNFNAAHDILVAITPLPSFDYGLYMASLQKLEKLNPAVLYFPHYGVGNQVKNIFRRRVTT